MDFRFSAEAQAIRDEAEQFVKSEWQNPGYDLTGGLAGWHGNEEEREAGHEVARQFAKKLVQQGLVHHALAERVRRPGRFH